MILGSGDIASVLNDREGAIFFASGVSNSQERRKEEFTRERQLLEQVSFKAGRNKSLFYFSTLSINFIDTPYTRHKNQMEGLIKAWFNNYNIIRIGNIDWGTNPNTFLNYIKAKQAAGEEVQIRDEWKYMISREQLRLVCDSLPLTGKNEISVFGECKKVKDLI